jgi:hypothetical protein
VSDVSKQNMKLLNPQLLIKVSEIEREDEEGHNLTRETDLLKRNQISMDKLKSK